MQYLPVVFAVFQIFFLLGLVVYYIVQTVLRIAQQFYITKRFYQGEHSLGRQAQAASEKARELAKQDGAVAASPFGGRGKATTEGGPAGNDTAVPEGAQARPERCGQAGRSHQQAHHRSEEPADRDGQARRGRPTGRRPPDIRQEAPSRLTATVPPSSRWPGGTRTTRRRHGMGGDDRQDGR